MASAELGSAIHRWRDRLPPGEVGLPLGGRRRASGLRREELAQLAGISVDYVTRLEQGRATNPSSQVVEALARALRLSAPERDHLYRLAGLSPPAPKTVPSFIPPSVHRLLDRLGRTPVAVYDATWTLLTANPPYAALMGDSTRWSGRQLNGVWRHFAGPGSGVRHTPESLAMFESALVADLRAAAGRYPDDRDLAGMIVELCAQSARFAELWDRGTVGVHEAARKTIDHPVVGALTLDCDVLSVAGSDLRIMVYTAEPGTEDAERLALLMVLGTQEVAVES
ncbi:helix-turn-helix transcriptional regulator [Streptomyces sp. NBC_00566]|uniref:helix-turn-helix transcriptional regulator n=1 Tax=Streptomyces sp. NBC_00566 TaxID=2975778 RepID=UPI002E81851D|nr:helix-turn-helix transcriptional regulator [Streptomyces sp. NBC_00566]WUB86278.1 helix-turn-helix transcriptional regulator [Streptomyces sp. NBC_00566]